MGPPTGLYREAGCRVAAAKTTNADSGARRRGSRPCAVVEEFIHHNLVLRKGPVAAVAAFSYRVRTPEYLDKAVAFYTELGCRVERREEGSSRASVTPYAWRTHSGSRTSSSTPSSTSSASPGVTTSTRPAPSSPRPLQPGHARRAQGRPPLPGPRVPRHGGHGVGSALARSARWNRVDGYLQNAADHVSVFVQIETAEGAAAAEPIAATPGIDGVFVGPSDLAASMGVLGQQTHPDVVAAVHRAFDGVATAGKPAGVNAFDPRAARAYVDAGARFVLVGADVALVARASEALATTFIHDPDDGARASY
ncbi:aldolase/citrate lyase family protein [Nonomuraea sp. B12E4]|uniref:aldolase/citrate lyase family protein n=1 Tax=Nonomuraea sp. B12E4 TaxID=3153564 RepID=UPI00325E7F27